jgi:hypothetical protein
MKGTTMNTAQRISSLNVDSATTLIDGAYTAQTQGVQLADAWLKVVAENQKVTRDLFVTLLKQATEAQGLWSEYVRESYRTNFDRFAEMGVQFRDASNNSTPVFVETKEANKAAAK